MGHGASGMEKRQVDKERSLSADLGRAELRGETCSIIPTCPPCLACLPLLPLLPLFPLLPIPNDHWFVLIQAWLGFYNV